MDNSPSPTERLFGRAEILDRILRRARDLTAGYRQNIALVGPPLIGKTSILQRAVDLIREHPPLLPVYLEIRPDASLAEFAERFASTLLYHYWSTGGREAPTTLEDLWAACGPFVPKTVALLAKAVAKARRGHASALVALFEAPGTLRQESGRLCVIMVDEFHRIAAWGKALPFKALERQIMVQQETMYILASSSVPEARQILQERLAVLFGHFEVIPVGPLDLATGVRFLHDRAGLADLGVPYLVALADLTEGRPFELDTLARAIRGADGEGVATAEARIAEALTVTMFRPAGPLAQRCEEAVAGIPASWRTKVLPVLSAVAEGHHRIQAIAEATGRTTREIAQSVRWLQTAGLVVRSGAFCRVENRLLRFWLQTAHGLRGGSVHLEPSAAEQAFATRALALLTQATSRAPQAVLEVMETLMRRFRNDLIELHGRRLRLPKMEVHTLLLPSVPRAVVGRHDGALWFCVPYSTIVRESDTVALVQTLRRVEKPWQRRIVVALEGIEINAKLFLQQQRFWVWELADVNYLLELYGLSRMLPTEFQTAPVTVVCGAASNGRSHQPGGEESVHEVSA